MKRYNPDQKYLPMGNTVSWKGQVPMPRIVAACLALAEKKGGYLIGVNSSLRTVSAIKQHNRSMGTNLHSQAELYNMFLRGAGNPANQPGFSSHEERSDGNSQYRDSKGRILPRGSKIRKFMVGVDSDQAHQIVQTLRALGIDARITYPTNPREQHHLNIFSDPTNVLRKYGYIGYKNPHQTFLERSLKTWNNKYNYRANKLHDAKRTKDKQAVEKWSKLFTEAKTMVEKRKKQLQKYV